MDSPPPGARRSFQRATFLRTPIPRALWTVLFWAAALRFLNLGVWPLWLDEGATWRAATEATWSGTVFAEANHPPLWWIVTRAWTGLFGDSEAALRAPAALLGLLSVLLGWLLARRLLDPAHAPARGGFSRTPDGGRGRRAALWFTGLFGLAAYFLELSQEARMYPALLAEALGLSLLYLRWLDRGERRVLVLYALLATAAVHTHYFGVWPPVAHAAHAAFLAWRTRGRPDAVRAGPFFLACAAAALLFVPWLLHLAGRYQGLASEPLGPFQVLLHSLWRIGVGPALVVADRVRGEAGLEAVMAEERSTVLVTALLWLVPVLAGLWALRRHPGLRGFLAANVLVPLLLLLALYAKWPLLRERYLVFLAPWPFLLAALGAGTAPRLLRPLLHGGLAVLVAAGALAYHFSSQTLVPEGTSGRLDEAAVPREFVPDPGDPLRALHHGHPYGREPWREVQAFVARHARPTRPDGPGDCVVLHPHYLHYVWDYYDRHRLAAFHLPPETLDLAAVRTRLAADLAPRQRVFLVLSHEHTEAPDHYVQVLRDLLREIWTREALEAGRAWRFQALGPIRFGTWGVRVAVFSRA